MKVIGFLKNGVGNNKNAIMELSIGFVNDIHGYVEPHNELFYNGGEEVIETAGGYARIATIFKNIKKENPNSLFFFSECISPVLFYKNNLIQLISCLVYQNSITLKPGKF